MSQERVRSSNYAGGPDAFSDEFATGTSTSEADVHVVYGPYAHSAPLAGRTVRAARGDLQERMHIDPEAISVVDGSEVDEDFVLEEGQVLTFVKHAGERGKA